LTTVKPLIFIVVVNATVSLITIAEVESVKGLARMIFGFASNSPEVSVSSTLSVGQYTG
jgi:hypothetical protein